MKPLAELPPAVRGSQPTDNGHLIVEAEDYDSVMADPIAAKYVRPFRMGRELIHGKDRWCLWLVDATPEDIAASSILSERTSAVREFRLKSKKAPTRRKAETPYLFDENHQPDARYVGVPRVFSERRKWATVAYLDASVIAGDKVYTVSDPDGFAFAIISSLMFMTWQKMIGGRLESRPNFSNTVVWNNLPLPRVSVHERERIAEAGRVLSKARLLTGETSLAAMYEQNPLNEALLEAHENLDRIVDEAFGGSDDMTQEEREILLIDLYLDMIGQTH